MAKEDRKLNHTEVPQNIQAREERSLEPDGSCSGLEGQASQIHMLTFQLPK